MGEPNMEVLRVLVQEAQQEIANLRTELYSSRRLAEERRQALEAMKVARDQIAAVAHQLEGKVQSMHQQVLQLPLLQQELHGLQELHERAQRESHLQQQARRILESELADERAGRSAAEEARAKAEAERSKLALARDDLAAQLRFAKQKAAEAEEEQLRAEEEAAQIRRELQLLQAQTSTAGGGLESSGDSQAASAAAVDSAGYLTALQDARAEAASARAEALRLQQQLSQLSEAPSAHMQQQQERLQEQQSDSAQVAALQAKVRAAEAESAAAREKMAFMQSELASARQQAAQAEAELQQVKVAGALMDSANTVAGAAAAAEAEAAQQEQALQEQVELLMSKVVSLKKSRDKLLAQMDRQSVELEQLLLENQALSDSLAAAQEQSSNWQAQAQDALASVSKIHSPLAAKAAATVSTHIAGTDCKALTTETDCVSGGETETAAGGDLQAALDQEQQRSALLDAQVRVLSAQLLRMHAAYTAAGRSLLPILGGVEARLLSLQARSAGKN